MPAIQKLQISIKRVDSYSSQRSPALNGQSCLMVESPYDETLKDEIKDSIPWQFREWTGSAWVVIENDPDQKPDEETNLACIQRIAKECADRQSWLLIDETSASPEAIAQSKEQAAAELLEQHVAAVTAVLPKLPSHSLRLTRWGSRFLSLQLTRYLGEDEEGYALFMELFKACANAWKNRVLASFDRKMSAGFVFEVANDIRIIRTLMQCRGIQYLVVHELTPTQVFEDHTAHLVNSADVAYIGIDYEQVDMSELDFESKSWHIAAVGDDIYWVSERDSYIREWLNQDRHSIAHFGGAFGVFIQQKSKLPELLELFHLEEWFKDWAIAQLESHQVEQKPYSCNGWSVYSWAHPADDLLTHLQCFSSYGSDRLEELIGSDRINNRRQEIQQLKEDSARAARAEARANAKALAKATLRGEHKYKADLVKYAERRSIQVRSTWTVERILDAITANQQLCEEIIKLPQE